MERNQIPWVKWLIPGLGQEKHETSLEIFFCQKGNVQQMTTTNQNDKKKDLQLAEL